MARRNKGGRSSSEPAALPDRDTILKFVADNPDRASKREIAKAFAIKGSDRAYLKDLLRTLEEEGLLEKRRKRLTRPGALPHVSMLEITGRDSDGGLVAQPAEWTSEHGDRPPVIEIRTGRDDARTRAAGVGSRVLAKVFPAGEKGGPDYTGRIIKVFEKSEHAVLGVLRKLDDGTVRAEPVERRQPELLVDSDHLNGAKPGDLVEIELLKSGRYGLAKGKVRTIIGKLDSEKAISMIAIHAHDIPHVFPPEVVAEAQQAKTATLKNREDWRNLPLITIDPADAKDHDDAVFAEPDGDDRNPGGHVVTVAIADVAAYVKPGSALDREALKRGNSVYFPDRVVPMLPERISNDLCSLREGEDRPALAVRMVIAEDGRKIRHTFHRVMMKSAAKLAYPQAQAAIDGVPDDKTGPLLEPVLQPLWAAYASLRRARAAREPLELDLPERKLVLNPDGTVNRVMTPPRLDAHRLIEEFMILANVAAAETLEQKKQVFVYRVHDAPSLAKQEGLREFLQTIGMSLARGAQLRPAQFNNILARVADSEHVTLVNEVVLRSQSQAEYSPANIGHFGLNLKRYAHFTSPIRRYADLIVHRALVGALGLGEGAITAHDEERLEEISAFISTTERRAMKAERETYDRLIASHLARHVDESFDGRISGVTKSGLFVQLPAYGADGFVPVSKLEGDYYIYDEASHALTGERTGKGFRLGDEVVVQLVEIAPLAGAMRFAMLSEPRQMPKATRSYHKSRSKMRAGKKRPTRRRR